MSHQEFKKRIEKLRGDVVTFERHALSARRDLTKTLEAYETYCELKGEKISLSDHDRNAPRPLPKRLTQIIIAILQKGPNEGYTRAQLYEEIEANWKPDIILRSLTSTLTKLKDVGDVRNRAGRWSLTATGRKRGV